MENKKKCPDFGNICPATGLFCSETRREGYCTFNIKPVLKLCGHHQNEICDCEGL